MLDTSRRFLLVLSLLCAALAGVPARAATWTPPSADELKMTSDPEAPDAPAVFLFREEIMDDKLHDHSVYARIKILTEKGKEEFSDIEIPYEQGEESVPSVEGRTIHQDGTVVPFTGKPYDKELVKTGNKKIMAKVFSMPDVQVGSILEYRWERQYNDRRLEAPVWQIQQSVFVHKAHFRYLPVSLAGVHVTVTDSLGKERAASRLIYYYRLPPNAKVQEQINGVYDLAVDNVPAIPEEEYSPPLDSFSYRVIFYYSPEVTGPDFWKDEAKTWSKEVDHFAEPSDKIRQAVAQIVSPGDSEDQKLRKIYAAAMTLENTRFTREHSAQENKAEGLRVKTAADIWEQKRGSDDEITRLFISMARAAGLKAYTAVVPERNRALLNQGYLNWGQLEDEIAIVNVAGKEMYFDPGQRYCEYGKLHWMHTQMIGFRQTDHGPAQVTTPSPGYMDNIVLRDAALTMGPDGKIEGTIRINMKGAEALRWRQEALRSDEEEAKKSFEAELQNRVPDGVRVRMNHFVALTDSTMDLMAVADVSGSMGTATGKRVFLPAAFF